MGFDTNFFVEELCFKCLGVLLLYLERALRVLALELLHGLNPLGSLILNDGDAPVDAVGDVMLKEVELILRSQGFLAFLQLLVEV